MGVYYQGHIQVKGKNKWVTKLSIDQKSDISREALEEYSRKGVPSDYAKEHPIMSGTIENGLGSRLDNRLPYWLLYSDVKNEGIELYGYATKDFLKGAKWRNGIFSRDISPNYRNIWPEVKELAKKFGGKNVRIIMVTAF